MQTKICTKCKQEKSIDKFYKHKQHEDKYTSQCKGCVLQQQAKYRKQNRQLYNTRARVYHHANRTRQRNGKLRKNYGSNAVEIYGKLFKEQKGLCAICGKQSNNKVLDVDHNHETKEIRGLLCQKCNKGVGLFNDNVSVLKKAVNYLEKAEKYLRDHQE